MFPLCNTVSRLSSAESCAEDTSAATLFSSSAAIMTNNFTPIWWRGWVALNDLEDNLRAEPSQTVMQHNTRHVDVVLPERSSWNKKLSFVH